MEPHKLALSTLKQEVEEIPNICLLNAIEQQQQVTESLRKDIIGQMNL